MSVIVKTVFLNAIRFLDTGFFSVGVYEVYPRPDEYGH